MGFFNFNGENLALVSVCLSLSHPVLRAVGLAALPLLSPGATPPA